MLFETGYFKNNYFYKFSFISVAFLAFLHMFRMVKMKFALVAIMLLATSMSKMYLIKTGQRHKARMRRTKPTLTKIEDDLDHLGQGEDEVNVIHVVGGKFLLSRIFFSLKSI